MLARLPRKPRDDVIVLACVKCRLCQGRRGLWKEWGIPCNQIKPSIREGNKKIAFDVFDIQSRSGRVPRRTVNCAGINIDRRDLRALARGEQANDSRPRPHIKECFAGQIQRLHILSKN